MDLQVDVTVGFIPDYYATDVKHDGAIGDIVAEVERARGFLESLTRRLALEGLSFNAVNLSRPIPKGTGEIYLATSSVLGRKEQTRLLEFARAGGKLLLYGHLPVKDWEGHPCTLLIDGIGCRPGETIRSSASRQLMVNMPENKDMALTIWEASTIGGGKPLLQIIDGHQPQVAAAYKVGKGTVGG